MQYLKAAPAADGKTLHHTLVEGLTALCKTKPAGLDAVRFLGEWLIANNPRNKDAGSDSKFDGPAAASAPIATMTPAAPALSVVFVLGGDDSTAGLCERLGKQFRFSVIKSSSTSTTAPSACLVELKDAIAQKGGSRFIVHGFPHTLEQAFAFERAIAQPLFVLLDGAEGPVADLYAKVGAAHAISGSGESAYASASKYFYPRVVFALGLPGCGRKKVSEALQASHGYRRLNLDELVDAEAASGSVFGRDIARTVALGDQLPSEWVIRLFQEAIDYDPTGCFIVDGYPRTVEQASEFAAAIAPPRFVLHLGVSEDEALRRMGAGAKKGIRVFKGRTQRYIDLMATLGLVR